MNDLCPCGSGSSYKQCCEIAHKNIKTVATAEALMRSRYSAFVKANIDYLLLSWSSKTKDTSNRFQKELYDWATSVQWVKLEVINTDKGSEKLNKGWVTFKAFYLENGTLECISERSYFEKENEHWVYVEAQ